MRCHSRITETEMHASQANQFNVYLSARAIRRSRERLSRFCPQRGAMTCECVHAFALSCVCERDAACGLLECAWRSLAHLQKMHLLEKVAAWCNVVPIKWRCQREIYTACVAEQAPHPSYVTTCFSSHAVA